MFNELLQFINVNHKEVKLTKSAGYNKLCY